MSDERQIHFLVANQGTVLACLSSGAWARGQGLRALKQGVEVRLADPKDSAKKRAVIIIETSGR